MNQIYIKKEKITQYKAVIFDLDGTLYYQRPFRVRMAWWIVGYIISHPHAVRDVSLIIQYRKVREHWEQYSSSVKVADTQMLDEQQYAYVAKQMNLPVEKVRRTIEFYMLEAPLKLLAAYRDEVLANIIEILRLRGITVVIYSDYPVQEKLKALGIEADGHYTSTDARIGCMKPAPKGIQVILKDYGLSHTDALMIGDRYEKDGLAAKENDVDFIIVGRAKKEREVLKMLMD